MPPEPSQVTANEAIIAAFGNQEMQLVDQVELTPIPSVSVRARRRGTLSEPADNTSEFALILAASEDAVVLLEQDGMFSWHFANTSSIEATRSTKRGGHAAAPQRLVTFTVFLPPQIPKQRTTKRGIIGDFVFDNVKAFIFKFTARIALGHAMKFLERNVRRGLVSMTELDPARWELITDPTLLKLPANRAARVLLFVHGTFSSTIGGYGSLAATPWGREFLRAAHADYDAVIGFDHATLSDDPLENATDLLKRLQSIDWPHPPRFDVITHSRGGLVLRCLTEHLLPLANFPARFERIIFVAATNGGTRLAEPENWHTLINLYTDLSVAASRLIGMMPQARPFTVILNEIIHGLGAFVKYCATVAIDERVVPGLAAMKPDGDFIKTLNEEQVGQPTVEQSYYCAITSDFKPRLLGTDHEPKELSHRLVQWITDIFVDQLMKEPNDLVVNTASMTRVDPQLGKYIKDSLDFGSNPQVYHTNYFVRPEVINALARWLRLTQPAGAGLLVEIPLPTTRRGKLGGVVKASGLNVPGGSSPRPDIVVMGGVTRGEVPAEVDTDIFVIAATTPVCEAIEAIEEAIPSFVVVRRDYQGDTLNYAFTTEEILDIGTQCSDRTALSVAFNLHEIDASVNRSVGGSMTLPVPTEGTATAMRAVVLDGDRPVGVVTGETELLSGSDLVELARMLAFPPDSAVVSSSPNTDFIRARRAMPTFSAAVMDSSVSAASRPRSTRSRDGKRAASPKKSAPSAPDTSAAAVRTISCHFRAEMDQEVILKRTATVEVMISREVIGLLVHASATEGMAKIDPGRKLLIQVLPKVNFETVDDGWIEIDPPIPDSPQQLYFILKASHIGEGEVWVVARQGQVPLVTLVLKPQVVKARSENPRRAVVTATTSEAPKLIAPLHQLFITERRNGGQVSYHFQLQSPDLKLLKWGESKPIIGDRQKFVARLYEEIETRWLSNKDDVDDFIEELRAIGAAMCDELLPTDLQQALWDYRDKIKRIMVIAEEPFIPWELVHLSQPGKPLSADTLFLGQMGLVRWLHEAGWPPDALSIRKGKACYVIPAYPHPDYELPEAQLEARFLEKKFGANKIEPKSSAVRKLLSQPGAFDLLHFACHGVAEQDNISNAQLMMEGRIESGAYLPDYFSATTAEYHTNLKGDGNSPIIVLNACQAGRAGYKLTGVGGFAQAFLRRGAGAFIGTLWSVGDNPARSFTEELYDQLVKGAMLAEATVAAREKARQAGDATWLAYVVYGHPHATITITK